MKLDLASQYRPHFCRTNIKQFSILYRGPTISVEFFASYTNQLLFHICFKKKNLKNYLIDSRSVA